MESWVNEVRTGIYTSTFVCACTHLFIQFKPFVDLEDPSENKHNLKCKHTHTETHACVHVETDCLDI